MATEIQSYRDLLIWQKGMDLAVACHRLCRQLPADERFEISSQLKRAAVSIPANIAEGHGRELPGSFVQYLRIAQGSLKELETLLLLIERIGLTPVEAVAPHLNTCSELGRMLRSMIRSIQNKQRT